MNLLEKLRKTLSDKLTYYRDLKGWTQHDLAAACSRPGEERSVSWVRGYEQMKRWPKPEELSLLAKALNTKPINLLVSEEDLNIPAKFQLLNLVSSLDDSDAEFLLAATNSLGARPWAASATYPVPKKPLKSHSEPN